MKFAFVILHYNTIEDTVKCVDSIKKLDNKNSKIIVVDNASPNKSGKVLQDKYKNDDQLDVILCDNNLGFAKGNNEGFLYAKEHFNPDFIVVSNSDVIFFQKNMCSIIEDYYNKEGFEIMGPDVLDITNEIHSSPQYLEGPSYEDTIKWLWGFRRRLLKSYIKRLFEILGFYKYLKKENTSIEFENKDAQNIMNNVVIHGCCVTASKKYIDKNDWIFYPETFLFNEELILWEIAQNENHKIVYNPDVKIIHNEHSSLETVDIGVKKEIFSWKNQIKSLKVLRKIQYKYKKEKR